MKQILIIEASPRGAESASRQLTRKLKERLEAQYPEASFVERDLAKAPLPHLDYRIVKAIFARDQAETESLKDALHLSNQVTEEVLSSGLLVIASPLWNFAVVAEGMGGSYRSPGTDLPLHLRRSRRARTWKESNPGACIRWSFH